MQYKIPLQHTELGMKPDCSNGPLNRFTKSKTRQPFCRQPAIHRMPPTFIDDEITCWSHKRPLADNLHGAGDHRRFIQSWERNKQFQKDRCQRDAIETCDDYAENRCDQILSRAHLLEPESPSTHRVSLRSMKSRWEPKGSESFRLFSFACFCIVSILNPKSPCSVMSEVSLFGVPRG